MATTTTYRFGVYSSVLDEHVTLNMPQDAAWMKRLDAVNNSGAALYGPSYRRGVVEALLDMSRFVGWGDLDAAELYLTRAEYLAGVRS